MSMQGMLPMIKICGITSLDDARLVVDSGATALGLILATSSREVSIKSAYAIAESLRDDIDVVGVFRDASNEEILNATDYIGFNIVQIHGRVEDVLCELLHERGVVVLKALDIESVEFLDFDDRLVDGLLVDGSVPGSGVAHSWGNLQERSFTKPFIAAGGLTPQTVEAVLRQTHAFGVDVASGVERAPGLKDPKLVLDFVDAAHRHFSFKGES